MCILSNLGPSHVQSVWFSSLFCTQRKKWNFWFFFLSFFLFFPWTTYRTLSKFDFETEKMRTMKTYNFFTKGHYIFETYFKLSSQTNSVWFSTILVKLTSSISYYNVFLILSWISTLLWKLPCWLQLLN